MSSTDRGKKNFTVLHVYNDKLVPLKNILCQPDQPFYIPYSIEKVQVCESFLVFKDMSEIIFLDKNNGWVKKRIQLDRNYDNFVLNLHTNRILIYDQSSNKVVSYDFNGKLETFDTNMPKTKSYIQLVDCLNERLLFFG